MHSSSVPPLSDMMAVAKRMQFRGFRSDNEGICFGLYVMSMVAFFLDQEEEFNKRIKLILVTPLEEFANPSTSKSYALMKDFDIFFGSVELHHQPEFYSHLLETKQTKISQNPLLTLPLIMPEALSKIGGVHLIGEFKGIYTVAELISISKNK